VLELNWAALGRLGSEASLEVVSGAGHLFEEPGALEPGGRAGCGLVHPLARHLTAVSAANGGSAARPRRLDQEPTVTHHQDAISLTEDHRTVEQLFADYERGLQSPEAKRQVVDQIIRELSIHAAIEEAYFYTEVKKALGEGSELVDESLHEHQEVKETLAALEDMDPADAAYDQTVASLIADVRHHVVEEEEEEGAMFPKLRSALSAEQLGDIGQKLADGKAKAPTHPHPAAPASGPGAKVAGPAAGMVDRVRDKLTDHPADPSA
jgi:hemerythrin superfamily protein